MLKSIFVTFQRKDSQWLTMNNNNYTETQPATTGGYAKYSAPLRRHSKSIFAYKWASLIYTYMFSVSWCWKAHYSIYSRNIHRIMPVQWTIHYTHSEYNTHKQKICKTVLFKLYFKTVNISWTPFGKENTKFAVCWQQHDKF